MVVRFKGAGGLVDGMAPSVLVSSPGSTVPGLNSADIEGLKEETHTRYMYLLLISKCLWYTVK